MTVACVFFRYDVLVDRRNEKLIDKFARSNAIVSSLFPKMYRDKLLGVGEDEKQQQRRNSAGRLKSLMMTDGDGGGLAMRGSTAKPLADIFPAVSIIFADIAGFT